MGCSGSPLKCCQPCAELAGFHWPSGDTSTSVTSGIACAPGHCLSTRQSITIFLGRVVPRLKQGAVLHSSRLLLDCLQLPGPAEEEINTCSNKPGRCHPYS